jgi:hypothetical protein
MIVYADRKRRTNPRQLLREIQQDGPLDALIELGQLESALADANCWPAAWDRLMIDVAHWWMGHCARPNLDELTTEQLPDEVELSKPEGFAWYSLYPEAYVRSAKAFARDHETSVVSVLGVRSIGTTLSAVVAATLEHTGMRVDRRTVRPTGHPFDRQWSAPFATPQDARPWLIVDEGPGISGSTFAAVALGLMDAGVPEKRILFMPAWNPSPDQLRAPKAQARWAVHQNYTCALHELDMAPPDARNLSGGLWRQSLDVRVPVQPQHERTKYKTADGVLWKFVGLGKLSRAHVEKARLLERAGFGPEVLGVEKGYLLTRWVEGRPMKAQDWSSGFESFARRYVEWTREMNTGEEASPEALLEMIEHNSEIKYCGRLTNLGKKVKVDGRMMPHEWLATDRGFVKADAVDHFDDHFFPGCQPVEWDIAGLMVEWNQRTPVLPCENLDFWVRAYASYRLGYAKLAGGELDTLVDFYERWATGIAEPTHSAT